MATTTADPGSRIAPGLLATDETRIDGRIKVSGQAKFTADYAQAGMLWSAFVASPYAHARIVSIDTSPAREMDGVHGVITGADIGERYFGAMLRDWPILAFDKVNFVGEYVAVVAAETREIAEAAAAAIEIEYEELPGLFDTEASIAPGAPPFYPQDESFVYNGGPQRPFRPHRNMHGFDTVHKGDPDAAFARASHVFEHTFYTPRYHSGYIEPRATLVWIDANGTYRVMCENKNPFGLRDNLARTLDLPKDKVVVESTFIGGEFGGKAHTIEEFPLYFLAKATGRPVKHVRTHADDVRSSHTRHASKVTVRFAMSDDGLIEAMNLRVLFDGGAYAGGKGLPWLVPGRTPKIPYRIPNAHTERMAVYTNTIPAGIVRAPADFQTLFAIESMMDIMAGELGIDPLELRLRNAIAPGDTDLENNPYARPRGREVLETAAKAIGWGKPLPPGRGLGIGYTSRHIAGGKTSMIVTAQENGEITVETGSTEPGVGTFTVIQRALAAELGVEPERISVKRGTTETAPWDPGIGGSKGTLLLGQAAIDAGKKLRAALALPHSGPVSVTGEFEFVHKPGEPLWVNFGAYAVDLSVDRDTGALTIHDIVFVADIGTIINPIAHRGQIDGGFLLGLGHTLTEELYMEDGRIVNIALSDYKLPCQRDMPPFRAIMLEPDGGPGPFGARAVGEMNSAGVAPAIANAVAAAVGVRLDRLSITAERVLAALTAKEAAAR
jgi:CO/xanthine dehydrogenase Mo-binding subunit